MSVSQTLYVRGICEKVGLAELKRTLYSLFSTYGTILEVRAHKGIKTRGQAWITFLDLSSAVKARNSLNKYYLFGGPISVEFSQKKSVVERKINGQFNPYGRKSNRISVEEARVLSRGAIKREFDFEMDSESEEEIIMMIEEIAAAAPVNELIPPNKILFVQHLPADTDAKLLLDMLFGQYRGYVECRPVPNKPDIAFVEFDGPDEATVALNALNGLELDDTNKMFIQYAK